MKRIMRKRRFTKRPQKKSAIRVAKRALKIAKSLSPEVKYYEGVATAQQFAQDPNATTYLFRPYAGIAQGTSDYGTRIGDRINVLRHTMHITLANNTNTPCIYRLTCAVLLRNPDGTITPTSMGNLLFDSTYVGGVNMVNAPFDYDNRKSFKVLYDKCFVINPVFETGAAAIYQQMKNIKINLRPPKNVGYFAGSSTSITTNDLIWFFTSNVAANANRYATFVTRTYYTDA